MRTFFSNALFLFFVGHATIGQVGINTTNPSAAAVLDIWSSSNNVNFGGVLLPRVSIIQRNSIPVSALDDGLIIFLSNGSNRCVQIYDGIENEWEDLYCLQVNQAPVASNVRFSGDLFEGGTLTASFDYSDNEGDPQGPHTYNWYGADDPAGTNQVLLQNGTSNTYTLLNGDMGSFIAVEVIPEATSGNSPGSPVLSAYDGPVTATPTGGLIISEIADPDNNTAARFIEVTNMSNISIDISGWELILFSNANTVPSSNYSFPNPTVLPSGGSFVVGQNEVDFIATYGFAPDGLNALFNSNGDDNYELRDDTGNLIDVYGSPGTDQTGSCAEFEDGRALRIASVTEGQTSWNEAEWIVRADDTVGGCTDHANAPQNAPADFSPGTHPN